LTIASKTEQKPNLALQLQIVDSLVEISDDEPDVQLSAPRFANPYGFDIVVEGTGALSVFDGALDYVRKGGDLAV
jgi:threonine dehydrogenase-like Zn-dependent dehydrogenase